MVERRRCLKTDVADVDIPPPDGGWGWLCVLGCFLTHVILGGLGFSGGVLFLELQNRYGGSSASISWVYSLRTTVLIISGPISGALSRRYTCRTVVMVGGVVCVVSMLVSAFTPNMAFLYFSYGVVGGFGSSLSYTPGLVVVGMYFKKRRGLAVGLSSSGAGVGAFVVPPVIEILFDYYGFTGAFILLGSLIIHLCLCGALYRPLHVHHQIQRLHEKILDQTDRETRIGLMTPPEESGGELKSNQCDIQNGVKNTQYKDINTHPGVALREQDEQTSTEADTLIQPPDVKREDTEYTNNQRKSIWAKLDKYIELSLLKNIRFLSLCLSILLFASSFTTAYGYIPPLAKSRGITELDAAYLISTAGICDLLGRIILSSLFDIRVIRPHRELCYVLLLLSTSAVAFGFPFMARFTGFAVLAGLFGFLTGGFISQKSIIIVDILGLGKLSSSFGIVLLFQGLGVLVGPPVAGTVQKIFQNAPPPDAESINLINFGIQL
ncbi:hypothetical protein ScPMuIL_010809 [Solemya velum]